MAQVLAAFDGDTLGGRASSPAIFLAANVAFAISRNGGRGRASGCWFACTDG